MLIIRAEQREVFEAAAIRAFVGRMVRHVAEFFPNHHAILGDARVRRVLHLGVERAAAHGLVTDVMANDFEVCRGHVAYLCGPPPMVEAALKTLMKKRLFPRDIYREDFFDSSDKATGGVRSPLIKTS